MHRSLLVLALLFSCADPVRPRPNFEACATVADEPANPSPAPLHTEGQYFKDAAGRVVLLRGVNVAGDSKRPPFATVTAPEQLDPLPGWGLNTVRLLFTWEAFEPQPCEYADPYLASIEQVTSWAEARGLYVILDFHQDAYSRYALDGCGEGFPEWSILSSIAVHAPDNGPRCADWGLKMTFDSANLDLWSAFHRDLEGARTRYLAMVSRVVARMSSHRNVVGYELLNEPWGEPEDLHSLFEAVGAAMRAKDPARILFVPSHALGFAPQQLDLPNVVHAPHYYDSGIYLSKSWGGGSVAGPLDEVLKVSQRWGSPMLLGEFGTNEGTKNEAAYLEALYTWLDARFVSGTQWNYTPGWTPTGKDGFDAEDFSISDDTHTLRPGLFTPRPSPQKTAGTPGAFARTATGFTYTWTSDPTLGTTELFLLDGQHLASQAGVTCQQRGHLLSCTGEQPGEAQVTVTN